MRGEHMLRTPLGNIVINVNGQRVHYETHKLMNNRQTCPDVNGRFIVQIDLDVPCAEVNCILDGDFDYSDIESGEHLEALSFYTNDTKLTIGVEADFTVQQGGYLANGIMLQAAGTISFGVCWLTPYSEVNEVQTWYGADLYRVR